MSPTDQKHKPRGGADDLPRRLSTSISRMMRKRSVVEAGVPLPAVRTWPSPRSTGAPHAGDADGMVGAEVIQTLVKRLPNAPGVYRMMNAAGDVLYVGKARSLKKRVTNYAQGRSTPTASAAWCARPRRWSSSSPAPRSRRCCSKPI